MTPSSRLVLALAIVYTITGPCMAQETNTNDDTIVYVNKPKRWSSLSTIAAGALIGASTGTIATCTDLPAFPFNWFLLWRIRKMIIDAMVHDAAVNNEIIDEDLLAHTAQLSDWIAYLYNPLGWKYTIHTNFVTIHTRVNIAQQ